MLRCYYHVITWSNSKDVEIYTDENDDDDDDDDSDNKAIFYFYFI